MAQRIRTGIIGLGHWGKKVARELNAVSELVAFASRSAGELWVVGNLSRAHRRTIEQIIGDQTIQALAIVTPISVLSTLTQAALSAGKHVFVEKPLAQSSDAAELIANFATKQRLILSTGYLFLYHPVYLELKRRAQLQPIRNIKIEWQKFGTFAEPIEHSLLPHHLSIMLDLVGEPENGSISYGPRNYTSCDRIETYLEYPNLHAISIIDRASSQPLHKMTIELQDGRTLLWEDHLLSLFDNNIGRPAVIYHDKQQPLAIEIARFINAAAGGDPNLPTTGSFAAKVLRVRERLCQVRLAP